VALAQRALVLAPYLWQQAGPLPQRRLPPSPTRRAWGVPRRAGEGLPVAHFQRPAATAGRAVGAAPEERPQRLIAAARQAGQPYPRLVVPPTRGARHGVLGHQTAPSPGFIPRKPRGRPRAAAPDGAGRPRCRRARTAPLPLPHPPRRIACPA